ncbi:hypothetical protein Bca4012_070515 [Brassica carinata]
MWKILQGALPIGENLRKHGMLLNIACCRCGELETVDHLFLHCTFAKEVFASSLLKQSVIVHEFLSFKEALISLHGAVFLPPLGVSIDLFLGFVGQYGYLGIKLCLKTEYCPPLRCLANPSDMLGNGNMLNQTKATTIRLSSSRSNIGQVTTLFSSTLMQHGSRDRQWQDADGPFNLPKDVFCLMALALISTSNRLYKRKHWPFGKPSSTPSLSVT